MAMAGPQSRHSDREVVFSQWLLRRYRLSAPDVHEKFSTHFLDCDLYYSSETTKTFSQEIPSRGACN